MKSRDSMFGYPQFDENGVQRLTDTTVRYKDTMMNIAVHRLASGKTLSVFDEKQETAFLLLEGAVCFKWEGNSEKAVRETTWSNTGFCLHICKGIRAEIIAEKESLVLVQQTENSGTFKSVFYTPETIAINTFGTNIPGNTAVREVTTIFDYHTAPYSNMVLGEIFNHAGLWSSYIPHSHEQPEVYYYRFDKPQGFGACFIGDDVFKIKHESFAAIPGGLTHPQVAAPAYKMTYVWMIRHFDGNPWTSRVDAPEHQWIVDEFGSIGY
ncbi:myo-inositol catabolism protein IolB [Treponema phagedenis F0421]|uniref:5-deoxy-glucuronate isomerase n=1 Tax=Treponema phagedenis TaxID=162 RepID=UPI0001F6418D|nr:5-deoxy-glucuronate isomerase [Treponema phagedenis]EFW38239.1 myo-inositol catabolism protein IolB [Treponema phagedenis F0421]